MASHAPRASAASRWAAICFSVARSTFDSTQIFFERARESCAATHSSPRPMGCEASMSMATTSTSSSALSAEVFSSSPRASWGLCRPGVSTKMSWKSSRVSTARKRCRVVCAVSDVMAIFLPMMALMSVDLPAFGLPTSVTKPDLKPSACGWKSIACILMIDVWGAPGRPFQQGEAAVC